MVSQIHADFPALFTAPVTQSQQQGGEREDNGTFAVFGVLPFVLTYCKLTNETISTTYQESVRQVFVVVSYEVMRIKEEEEALRRFKSRH